MDKVGDLDLRDASSPVEQRLFVLNVGQLPNMTRAARRERTEKRTVRREIYRVRKSVAHASSQFIDLKKAFKLAFEDKLTL